MTAVQLMSVVGALVLLMGWGGFSSARSELRATVEDSTTIVVTRGDSVVFRREVPFASIIDGRTLSMCEGEAGQIALMICYQASDTTMVNPLPRAYTHHAYKDLTLHYWRKHLLLIGCGGDSVIGHDLPWHLPGCKNVVFSDPDTALLFYFDTGELVRIDLATGTFDLIVLSDWGHSGFPGEEPPEGIAMTFPGHRVAVMRSGYVYNRSEVLLLEADGEILWKREDAGVQRHALVVVRSRGLVVTGQIRWEPGAGAMHFSQFCQAISEGGEVAWTVPLGEVVVAGIRVTGGAVLIDVRPRKGGQAGSVPGPTAIEIDSGTGLVVE